MKCAFPRCRSHETVVVYRGQHLCQRCWSRPTVELHVAFGVEPDCGCAACTLVDAAAGGAP